jgi:hypothetical protein
VLGSDPALPLVWIPQRRPKPHDIVYLQYAYPFDETEVGVAGLAPPRVVRAELTAASGEQIEVTVRDGWFAGAGRIAGPLFGEDAPVLEGYDAAGHVVWSRSMLEGMLPAECMSSFEERHGC